jgi:hypothetical protein
MSQKKSYKKAPQGNGGGWWTVTFKSCF